MVWQKEIDEMRRRKEMAEQMGGAAAIAKQHARGRLTIRERINKLLDPDSFQEIGTLAGSAQYDDNGELKSFIHKAEVGGYGKIDDRRVAVFGGDFTISGITGGGYDIRKLALQQRIPLLNFMEGGGASVGGVADTGWTYFPGQESDHFLNAALLLGTAPIIVGALGGIGGGPAVWPTITHFSVMTKHTSIVLVGGPPLVKQALSIDITKEELGSYRVHVYQSGVIDNVAEDEEDAIRQMKRFLSYLPQNVWQQPPRAETGDDPNRRDEELVSIIPKDSMKQYDIRQLIKHIVDKDSIFERQPFYGRDAVTLLARMDGYPVAILANDVKWFGGATTAQGCEKMMRFIDIADTFHIPIICLMDSRGFMIGPQSERDGIERWSARLAAATYQATVPRIPICIKRSFGVAGSVLGMGSDQFPHYAWPSGEWGILPVRGGVALAYKGEIEAAPDPEVKRREIEERLTQYNSPFLTAEHSGVDEIIDPRDTRPLLCEFARHSQQITATQLGPKYRFGIRP